MKPIRALLFVLVHVNWVKGWNCGNPKTRRIVLEDVIAASTLGSPFAIATPLTTFNNPVAAAELLPSSSTTTTTTTTKQSLDGLAARLKQRDPTLLANSVFHLTPPSAQVYPQFLRGVWNVTCRFNGFMFPSQRISKQRLVQDYEVPGFQKCSIVATCDVGKDVTQYQMEIDETTGLEDRSYTLTNQINTFLGYSAVKQVIYNINSNPNRISIDFFDYRTRNAERIELFCNARESEYICTDGDNISHDHLFVCSEYVKQITFGGGPDVGIARQVAGNYAHFWTWQQHQQLYEDKSSRVTGNLLTAAYLDPQDPLYFEEPSLPVAIYSHALSAIRIDA